MGDTADFALDMAYDDCEEYDNFMGGYYSPQEAYDRGFIDELGGEGKGLKGWNTLFYNPTKRRKVSTHIKDKKQLKCNACGSVDVVWSQYPSGKWFLFTNGKPHVCTLKD